MRAPQHRPRRWRSAAVAAVLVAGGAATVATTPPVERCPEPPAGVAPSAFYGDQKYDESHVRRTEPSTGEADGFAVSDAQVRVPSCVAEGGSTAEVAVTMDYARTGPGDAEDLGAGMRVTDGDGQTYEPRDVHADPGNPAQDGRPATPAALSLTFELPIDVPGPVLLHLGGPADDVLSLDPEPAAVPTGGSADASARP